MSFNIINPHLHVFHVCKVESLHFIDQVLKTIFISKVTLVQVTCDHEFRSRSDAGDEHLHLVWCSVLHFIGDDETICKCSPSHVPQGFDENISFNLYFRHVIFKNIKHWSCPWFHLSFHRSRQVPMSSSAATIGRVNMTLVLFVSKIWSMAT